MNIFDRIVNALSNGSNKFSGSVKTVDNSKSVLFRWKVPANTINIIETRLTVRRADKTEIGSNNNYLITKILTNAKNVNGIITCNNMGSSYFLGDIYQYGYNNNDGVEGDEIIFFIYGIPNMELISSYECEIIESIELGK